MLMIKQLLSTLAETQVYRRSNISQLFRRACLMCKSTNTRNCLICADCKHSLPTIKHACTACSLPLPTNKLPAPKAQQYLCGACLKNPIFERGISLAEYKYPISTLIIDIKHNANFIAGRALGELLAEKVICNYQDPTMPHSLLPDYMVPVPLHHWRLRQRGFNQSLELAKTLKRNTRIPILTKGIKRIQHTSPQQSLKAAERIKNLTGAFKVSTDLSGKHIAIVDDVVTTGTTARILAKELKQAGATRIDLWSIARTDL